MPSVSGGRGVSLVRLPLIRTVVQGDKVLLKIVGSALAPVGSADNLYLGPNGYVADPTQAQDFAAKISQDNIIVESPGAPGKSAYELWLMAGHEGTQNDYQNWLRGNPGQNASDEQIANKVQLYLAANPPVKGDNATDSQVANKVAEYLTANPPAKGDNATNAQVASAVAAYLTANPPQRGLTGPTSKVSLGSINITQTAAVALVAGDRDLTFTVSGLLKDEDVLIFPTAHLPTGYTIKSAVATANNTLSIRMTAPLLALGSTYSIPCRVVALR